MRDAIEAEIKARQAADGAAIQSFIASYGLDAGSSWRIAPEDKAASPVYLLTGIGFSPADPSQVPQSQAIWQHQASIRQPSNQLARDGSVIDGETVLQVNSHYAMNSTATTMKLLLDMGCRVIAHTKDKALLEKLLADHPNRHLVVVTDGDLCEPAALGNLDRAIAVAASQAPISEVKMVLYNSFAQAGGEPFKPMHEEQVSEVHRAQNRRMNFVYNMAALSYHLLMNKGQQGMQMVALAALAAKRASFGLLADAADKFAFDLGLKTMHTEINHYTGKPMRVVEINPGIVTAGNVYTGHRAELVRTESVADGFPLAPEVLAGKKELPQLSAWQVGAITAVMITTPSGEDPNQRVTPALKKLMWAGYDPAELRKLVAEAIHDDGQSVTIKGQGHLPDYVLHGDSCYGALPTMSPRGFYRVNLTPPGQKF